MPAQEIAHLLKRFLSLRGADQLLRGIKHRRKRDQRHSIPGRVLLDPSGEKTDLPLAGLPPALFARQRSKAYKNLSRHGITGGNRTIVYLLGPADELLAVFGSKIQAALLRVGKQL